LAKGKWGLSLFFSFLSLFFLVAVLARAEERVLELGKGETLRYEILDSNTPKSRSARETAERILRHLAVGEIEEAAALSNSPQQRSEVLRDYRTSVGDEEFKRVFGQYRQNRIVAEIAMGSHRLIIWDLAETSHHLAGQFYVEVAGHFLMDDVPSEARSRLRRVLQSYRKSATPSQRTD
jgi:hypothetical protein